MACSILWHVQATTQMLKLSCTSVLQLAFYVTRRAAYCVRWELAEKSSRFNLKVMLNMIHFKVALYVAIQTAITLVVGTQELHLIHLSSWREREGKFICISFQFNLVHNLTHIQRGLCKKDLCLGGIVSGDFKGNDTKPRRERRWDELRTLFITMCFITIAIWDILSWD